MSLSSPTSLYRGHPIKADDPNGGIVHGSITADHIAAGAVDADISAIDLESVEVTNIASGEILVGDGDDSAAFVTPSGDITMDSAGVVTIEDDAITTDKIADAQVTAAKLGGLRTLPVQTVDMAGSTVTLTINQGAPTGTLLTGNILYVDPNIAGPSSDLLLPPEADCVGLMLDIVNTGGEGIVIKDDAGTLLLSLETANTARVLCDGTTWRGFVGVP